jgi:hypothetical protein
MKITDNQYTFAPLENLTKWMSRILKFLIFLYSLCLFFDVLHFLKPIPLDEETELFHGLSLLIDFPVVMIFLVLVPLFGIWIIRANKNVRSLGAEHLSISPGWALGYFFVPIVNLFKPLKAMNELFLASHAPDSWHQNPKEKSRMVNYWWVLFTGNLFLLSSETKSFYRAVTVDELNNAILWGIVGTIISILSCKVTIDMIRAISNAQIKNLNELN